MVIAVETSSPSSDTASEPHMVLIIDDDRAVVDGLRELLENEGFAVATAADGLHALEQLRAGLRPSVILLDLMMPRMDGWDFRHEQIQDAALRDIPVVVITAAGFSIASLKAQFGDILFVPKPTLDNAVVAAVRRCCDEDLS